MDKAEYININQENINAVWREVWKKENAGKEIFRNRFFLEAYPVLKKYFQEKANKIGAKILEVGTGTGRYGLKIAQDFPESKVFLTDILEESLGLSRKLAEGLGVNNVEFKKEDARRMSFPDNEFDLVFSDAVIQHLPGDLTAVREMARVLKPGGRMVLSVVNKRNFHTLYKMLRGRKYEYGYEKSYTRSELRKILEENGLRVKAEDGFYVGYGLYRLKKYHRVFSFLGKAVNKISKILDKFTNRFFSRNFGFEIVIVGEK